MPIRNLVVVFGDQLWLKSPALEYAESKDDRVVMMEVAEEATYIPQHKIRLVLFFSAMRHFREELAAHGFRTVYSELDDRENRGHFAGELKRRIDDLKPECLVCLEPGDWRVRETVRQVCQENGLEPKIVGDTHFLSSVDEFREFAENRKSLVMEYFYRHMRRKTGWLMKGGDPVSGQWNYDSDNRQSFGRSGPPEIKPPRRFQTDEITDAVITLVKKQFPDSPGSLDHFDYPVTRQQGLDALHDFVEHRLAGFGPYQDAMASGEPYLFHSRLSAAMNLHLIHPREVVEAVIDPVANKDVELNSVEGFVRQVIGWREFVRGIYWTQMPDYAQMNYLDADLPMPAFMWTGETEMNCLKQSVGQLIDHAYAHHIQRLMVLGLYAMLLGVKPYDVHRWHISMYADAIDWVSLPNVLGMSQHGDGGIVGTKPYAASGNYISKMSDYCAFCRYDPKKSEGEDACPMTVLYWDFLSRNRNRLKANRRMDFQFKNLDRKDDAERRAIRKQADAIKAKAADQTYL